MRIAAHRGNRLHAPENSLTALISGYTGGADVLEFDVQMTRDERLVISHDPDIKRLTGQEGVIREMTFHELKAFNFGATFQPRDSPSFHYYNPASTRKVKLETLPELLEMLPPDVELLIELKHDSSIDTGMRDRFVRQSLAAIDERNLTARVVLYSKDPENLRLAKQILPALRVAAFDYELSPDEQFQLMEQTGADGLVTELASVLQADGQLTELGTRLEAAHESGARTLGAILYPLSGVFSEEQYRALENRKFVWSLSTDSMIDVAPFVRKQFSLAKSNFAGEKVNQNLFAFGYAKANKYAYVYQKDGVHVEIDEYTGAPFPPPTPVDEVDRRLQELETKMMWTAKTWEFYSGGGFGLVRAIKGDFCAETEYRVENVGQATTLEMAILNVDPGAHRDKRPTSARHKNSFYDPHGAPPYVGVEHDEDDGYRINWNLGSEYDNNQYGKPIGDGKTPRGAEMRIERRGAFFAAYYRNPVDENDQPLEPLDWVCVGVARNDSLNQVVYLRCVGKRWLQEKEERPWEFMPILPNKFTFKNLTVTRFPR
ncbi:MAG TPA: glycerophosphodiester phosphodiesterase family protein [Pyrinomonadaceae bacterium]|jgi:glycerophosphoryl diester phosphodiesterase